MPEVQSGDIEGQQSGQGNEAATWWCRILVKIVAAIAAIGT